MAAALALSLCLTAIPTTQARAQQAPAATNAVPSATPAQTAEAPAPSSALPPITFRQDLHVTAEDHPVLEAFCRHAMQYARSRTPEAVAAECLKAPETFAWIGFRHLISLNIAYQLTGDTAYLDQLRDTFALYRAIMTTEGDEFLGWYGSPIKPRIPRDKPDIRIDELQMNFRAMKLLGDWVTLAKSDAVYAARHAETIAAYTELMEKHLYPKWDKRGFYTELSPGGPAVYHGLDYPITGGVTLSHEKTSIAVDGLLALHAATGKPDYLRRALQLGARFKQCLSIATAPGGTGEHYEWMSWCPAGKWDVGTDPAKPDTWKIGWMAPDPRGEWYVASLSIALNFYQRGLLFSEEDLQRFIRTQKEMCWDGNLEKPGYRNVAGATSEHIKGRYLSLQLAPYDETLTRLAFHGVYEKEAQAPATLASNWKGGVQAQDYIVNKYLLLPRIAGKGERRPLRAVGENFLKDKTNEAFHSDLNTEVKPPGAVSPRKPSEAGF
ncbi:hypothetical protein DB346_11840 [Verrucomicrobia bacterium LW23]|nr:hypothetical protein DB346_11840 [Verrucomicrobia bacterium LW23]